MNRLEQRIARQYSEAAEEMHDKIEIQMKQYQEDLEINTKRLMRGEIKKEQFDKWKRAESNNLKYRQELADVLAEEAVNSDRIAVSMVNDYLPEVFAQNANYEMFKINQDIDIGTSFSLYNKETVKKLMRDKPDLYPRPKLDIQKDEKWNKRRMREAITQGILQGESVPKIAGRVATVADMDKKSAIRIARTMTTSAQACGRISGFEQAQALGIDMIQVWVATLDSRTRHSHIYLDGQRREVGEPFNSLFGNIMYPGDPGADPADIYNCRCAIEGQIKGYERDMTDTARRANKLPEGMSYEDWKNQPYEKWTEAIEKADKRNVEYTLGKQENKIRFKPVESAVVIDKKGNILVDKSSGDVGAVYFTKEECELMVGSTFTHNHPGGTCFSPEDLSMAYGRGIKEMRACHTSGFYSIERQFDLGSEIPKHYADFADDYKKAVDDYMKDTVDKVWEKTQDPDLCNGMVAEYRRKWMRDNSDRYGWKYREG